MRYVARGFLYNIGKYLFFILLVIILFILINLLDIEPKNLFLDVYATDNWGSYLNNDSIVYKHSYLSNTDPPVQGTTACSDLKWCSQQFYTGALQTFYLSQYVERLKYGHTYYFSQTICSSNANFQNVVANGIHVNFSMIGWNLQLSGIDVSQPNGSYSFRTCKKYIGSFDVTSSVSHTMGSADYIGIRYNRTNTSNYDIYLVESVLKDAGLNSAISSEITSTINSSISDVSSDIQVLNNKMTEIDNGINQVNNSIQQGNQTLNNINNNQKETNDLLKDDSIDLTDNDVNQWMGTITGQAQLNSTITSIFNDINSFKNLTCQPLHFNLMNHEYDLPCMSSYVYRRFNTFYVIYQIIIGGCICLGCISKWIDTFNKILDPLANNDTKIAIGEL